ncbi:uncharacterized protein si:dkey-238o13.4 isoform X2 [Phyllopteryx taeniolatus]|uniref:uncharacterized protein si:dkey-238o13.4 isoform X2 n=1 Tax=Phyllopteryx taeniolatus TaxID=161469 RepID=UPI002AD4901C|nr:uncharacterized protein si:dkey-238o13.4 isoform X2 [Phyllopteryx taeniolatus]
MHYHHLLCWSVHMSRTREQNKYFKIKETRRYCLCQSCFVSKLKLGLDLNFLSVQYISKRKYWNPTFLQLRGFKVAVISRDSNRLEKLRSFISANVKDSLITIVGDVGSEDGVEQAKQALLEKVGKITDVVSSLGFSWWQGGPPHTQTLKDLHWVIESLLFSTFVSWKAFFPLVKDDSKCTYTFITGGAGEKLLMHGTGFLTVGAASALAFCQVLREEYSESPCKLYQASWLTWATILWPGSA